MNTPLALKRARDRGVSVSTIIDVGASDGAWSAAALMLWPEAKCHLIEANPVHEPGLKSICSRPNFSYVLAAAAETTGTGRLIASDDIYGGTLVSGDLSANERRLDVNLTTLDEEVRVNNLPGPFLVKLDTHGFEPPILAGAKAILENTSLLVIESYVFDIGEGTLKFYEMCSLMETLGFRVIDLSEPLWRPYDKSLWQFDLFFIPKGSNEFSYNRYN